MSEHPQVPESIREQAFNAAFPGLPACMTMQEAKRRSDAAVDEVYLALRESILAEEVGGRWRGKTRDEVIEILTQRLAQRNRELEATK